jgi:hypothetical protein
MLLFTAQLGEDETGDSPVTPPAILYLSYQLENWYMHFVRSVKINLMPKWSRSDNLMSIVCLSLKWQETGGLTETKLDGNVVIDK